MQVLVTRPQEDAEPLVRELAARGYEAVVSPLLRVRHDPDAPVDLTNVQALLFTSANGVRAFAAACARRELPALTVGAATAEAARAAGFVSVETAGGDAAALADLVGKTRTPEDGTLFHAAGSVTAGDMKARLEAHGFTVRRTPLYAAEPVDSLSDAAVEGLRTGAIGAVLFFSPRTARTFVTLAHTTDLANACGHASAVCLSAAVANAVSVLRWRDVRTAERPDREALLQALDEAGAT